MELQTVLQERRSVRKYDVSKTVTAEDIKALIAAAQQAPSWKNQQTSRYHCVLSEEMGKRFREQCLPSFNAQRSEGAALIITTYVKDCVGFNTDTGEPTNELGNGWGIYDLGLQSENILLKAKDMGLDTLVIGIRNADKIREVLNIPDDEVVVSVIAVGYAAEKPNKPKRRDLSEILQIL